MSFDLDAAFRASYEVATFSPDPSTQNGAVLYDFNGVEIGRGCNNFPSGVDVKHWHDREQKYPRVVHAEVAAILDAGRLGNSTIGSVLVCPWAACSNCAKHIAYAGVSVLYRHPQETDEIFATGRWHDECMLGDEIMREAGIALIDKPVVQTDLRLRRNGHLWPAV